MQRGPLYMMFASAAFTLMLGTVKVAREELSSLEIMCFRGIVSVPLAALLCIRGGVSIQNRPAMVLRAVLGFGSMGFLYSATKGLPVAGVTLVSKLQPILVALVAPAALGPAEAGGMATWLSIAGGVLGCAVILAPELSIGSPFGLFALAGTVLSAGAHLTVRALGRSENPYSVVFWFQFGGLVLSFAALVATTGRGLALPSAHVWPALALCGVAATAGQVWMTRAYQIERAAVVAAASYTDALWAMMGDLLWFGALPTAHSLVGGLLIVGSGLFLVMYHRRVALTR